MHQTKKGNQWHFGMKAHIGVDADTGIVHSLSTTAANAHDVTEAHNLLHGGETQVWCDAGYQGVHKREENLSEVEWQVAMRPGKRRTLESPEAIAEKGKASVRAKVEHPFLKVKRIFGYAKVRYRGLAKNTERLVIWTGQPADGGGSRPADVGAVGPNSDQTRTRLPATALLEQNGKTASEAGLLSRNSPGNHQKNPRRSCSEFP